MLKVDVQAVAINFSHSQNLSSNSPFCLPHSSYDVSVENLVLDQFIHLIRINVYCKCIPINFLKKIQHWSSFRVRWTPLQMTYLDRSLCVNLHCESEVACLKKQSKRGFHLK